MATYHRVDDLVTCGLTACIHWDQLRAQCSVTKEKLYLYLSLTIGIFLITFAVCIIVFSRLLFGRITLYVSSNVMIEPYGGRISNRRMNSLCRRRCINMHGQYDWDIS